MKSHPWRFFLAFGVAAAVVSFLLPNDERLSTASSAVLHYLAYLAAGAVVSGQAPPAGRSLALVPDRCRPGVRPALYEQVKGESSTCWESRMRSPSRL